MGRVGEGSGNWTTLWSCIHNSGLEVGENPDSKTNIMLSPHQLLGHLIHLFLLIVIQPRSCSVSSVLTCLLLFLAGSYCSHHYDWWGLWLPYKAPGSGGLRRGKDHLPVPIHRQQVQSQVHHHSRHRLQGKKSGESRKSHKVVRMSANYSCYLSSLKTLKGFTSCHLSTWLELS